MIRRLALTAVACLGLGAPASAAADGGPGGSAAGGPASGGAAGGPASGGAGGATLDSGADAPAGSAGMPGAGGSAATPGGCVASLCPNTQPGATPCCVTPLGPCGEDFGGGCAVPGLGLPIGARCFWQDGCARPQHFCHGVSPATGSGFCSRGCLTDAECESEQPGTLCAPGGSDPLGRPGVCLVACTLGGATGPSKCMAGACGPVWAVDGTERIACRPTCSERECRDFGGGTPYCDYAVGVCVETEPPQGLPPGAPCSPGDPATRCRGTCASTTAGAGRCFDLCSPFTMGPGAGCGATPGPGQPPEGLCGVALPGTTPPHPADARLCAAPCNCDDECGAWGTRCVPGLSVPGSEGYAGLCVPLEAVPDAGAEGVSCDVDATVELGGCVQGATRACRGATGCLGVARCLDDRSGYGPCSCATQPPDGGAPVDADTDAAQDASPRGRSSGSTSGCGCRAAPDGDGTGSMAAAALAAVLAVRVRRRRSGSGRVSGRYP